MYVCGSGSEPKLTHLTHLTHRKVRIVAEERKDPPELWTVVVEPLEDEVPAAVRVKRWLKAGLRGYGLKCVEVRDAKAGEVEQAKEGQG